MAIMKGMAVIAAALVLIFIVSYWAAGRARPVLDQSARDILLKQGEAYAFLQLPDGVVHYHLSGPATGPLVVLVHGFSLPSFVWDDYIQPLNAAGFRVLAYDNYGRGFSDRPKGPYDAELMDRQLSGLLDALMINAPVDLVGYSMGGAISTIFAAKHPDRVNSLTLIAPGGLGVALGSATDWVKKPVIGDWIVRLFGLHIFHERAAAEAKFSPNPPQFLARFDRQMEWRGFGDALLSTLRNYPLESSEEAFRKAGEGPQPVLVIWGEADKAVPFSLAKRIVQLMPRAQIYSYQGMGHEIPYAQAPLVSKLLVGFLTSVHADATTENEAPKAAAE